MINVMEEASKNTPLVTATTGHFPKEKRTDKEYTLGLMGKSTMVSGSKVWKRVMGSGVALKTIHI